MTSHPGEAGHPRHLPEGRPAQTQLWGAWALAQHALGQGRRHWGGLPGRCWALAGPSTSDGEQGPCWALGFSPSSATVSSLPLARNPATSPKPAQVGHRVDAQVGQMATLANWAQGTATPRLQPLLPVGTRRPGQPGFPCSPEVSIVTNSHTLTVRGAAGQVCRFWPSCCLAGRLESGGFHGCDEIPPFTV